MKILKRILKTITIFAISIIALLLLAIGVLNIFKFAIYRDYYKAESTLCRNPGLSDGFVC